MTQYIRFRSLRPTNVAVRHGAKPIQLDCFTDDAPLQGADSQRTATCLRSPTTTTQHLTSPKKRLSSSTALGEVRTEHFMRHAFRLRVSRMGSRSAMWMVEFGVNPIWLSSACEKPSDPSCLALAGEGSCLDDPEYAAVSNRDSEDPDAPLGQATMFKALAHLLGRL